jgi:hypothetical protein
MIRIASPTPPISCGYAVTYPRDRAAFLRDAADAKRDDLRPHPAHPAQPLGKNAKNKAKKEPKMVEKIAYTKLQPKNIEYPCHSERSAAQ